MIYELAVAAKAELSDDAITKLQDMVAKVVKDHEGEILVSDDWGQLSLPQDTRDGVGSAHFIYFIFKANNENNVELTRRLRLSDGVLRQMIIKLGEDDEAGEIVKKFKTPYSKKYNGSVTETEDGKTEDDRDRKKFARRKTCYFTAKKITADWKDPKTYSWLVNEFGKISPARVSNISRKHQRFANTAIKRARNIGLISHLSNYTARPN